MPFNSDETAACQRLIDLALREDLGATGDVTSRAVIPELLSGTAVFEARSNGVVAGLPAAQMVAAAIDPGLDFRPLLEDGARVEANTRLATLAGPMRSILAAERTALNFLQQLSGSASLTRRYVDAIGDLKCHILDTRKTLPGYRLLAKYAVRCGGGVNHRLGLYDGILIKDNHLAALTPSSSPLLVALTAARAAFPTMPIEIEVDNLVQFTVALQEMPTIIMLDNMTPADMRTAVASRNAFCLDKEKRVLLEASGGVTLDTVRAIAETGVDRISVGALTHSAPALDIALDYEHAG